MWLIGGLPTLLLAINHHEAELAGKAADGACWQSKQGSKPLPMWLAEAHHWVWSRGRAHVLTPLQTFDPWQWALWGGRGAGERQIISWLMH